MNCKPTSLIPCVLLLLIWFCHLGSSFSSSETSHNSQSYTGTKSYSFTKDELLGKREEVRSLIEFAIDSYMDHGFPFDEVRPISCVPNTRNWGDPNDINKNDVLGNLTITLFDSLTTLAVIGDTSRFKSTVKLIDDIYNPKHFSFANHNATLQVFETTIRIVGSLLSSHLYAIDPQKKVYLGEEYAKNPFLLTLAKDLADRLLPAYLTETGLPYPRINLMTGTQGIPDDHMSENNAAGMASPMFEFTLLSYLTGDSKYELVTRYAFNKIWQTRTQLGLIPSSINPKDGSIMVLMTGIGASIDSFYEYALKGAILYDDNELYQTWDQSYNALKLFSRQDWFYTNVMSNNGQLATGWIDSLSAFWSGLQVLDGDLEDSIRKHLLYTKLWNKFNAIPERWAFNPIPEQIRPNKEAGNGQDEFVYSWKSIIPLEWYPLRPEFVESTYYLYRATKDPFYLNIGYQILNALQTKYKAQCGFAGIQDIGTNERQDRMETFVISETLKYLYLLFDESNEIHKSRDNIIFSTEAHPVWLDVKMKQWYNETKYFNDTIYVDHLNRCQRFDEHVKQIDDNGQFEYQYLRFKRNDDNDSVERPTQGTCPNYMKDWNYQRNITLLPYSNILSDTKDLFELETRYDVSLPQSSDSNDIELNPLFYDQWANPKSSVSKLKSTLEYFDLIFALTNDYVSPKIEYNENKHRTLHFHQPYGTKKFCVGKMIPGQIDSYGKEVSVDSLLKADFHNVADPRCNRKRDAMGMVYRVSIVDGLRLNDNDTIVINGTYIKPGLIKQRSSSFFNSQVGSLEFGFNRANQLTLGCVPLTNVYLV